MGSERLVGSQFELGTEHEELVLSPKTGEVVLHLAEASVGQVDKAVDAAEKAFQSWSRTTPAERSGYLLIIADAVERVAEGLAALEALNCGKPYHAVWSDEIPAVIDCYCFFAGAGRNMQGPISAASLPGQPAMIRRHSAGIVCLVATWN